MSRPADRPGPVAVGVHTGSGRDGTGEAVLVAIRSGGSAGPDSGGAAGGAQFLRRCAVTLVGDGTGQVLHRAQAVPPRAAAALVDDAATTARRLAGAAIADLLASLDPDTHTDADAVVPASLDADRNADVDASLGADASLDADASLGADVDAGAGAHADAGVVVGVPTGVDAEEADVPLADVLASHRLIHVGEAALFRDAVSVAADDAGLAVVRLVDGDVAAEARTRSAELAALGRVAGRPWRRAEREAAAAALLALTGGATRADVAQPPQHPGDAPA